MSILTLRNEIQTIIEGMDLTYIRATEDQANIEIDRDDLFNDLAIHIDQTTVLGTPAEFGTYVYKSIPTEILFISKNLYQDEPLFEVDSIIDAMESKADEFYDYLIRSDIVDKNIPLPGYELERLNAYKRFNATLSGVLFTMDVPVPRLKYYCPNGS